MKNEHMLMLSKLDFSNIDLTTLDASAAYKVFKFIRKINEAAIEFEKEKRLIVNNIIGDKLPDLVAYEASIKSGSTPKLSKEEYVDYTNKLVPLLDEQLNSEIEINIPRLTWLEYFELKKANKNIFTIEVDRLLENVLWEEPNNS